MNEISTSTATASGSTADYSTVTESPGNRITTEALSMMMTRYELAARVCVGKDVLEVACGAGQGLGYLARRARSVVGGDCTASFVEQATSHYGDRVEVLELDAHELPFGEDSFDVVILFEAVYYLARPERFLEECRRVLRDGGVVMISSANPERVDFQPSPHSVRYYSARELGALLRENGFAVELSAAFGMDGGMSRTTVVSLLKRVAVACRLIPRTMKGKELLKRIFLGRLEPMPVEIDGQTACWVEPSLIADDQKVDRARVVYAVGRLRAAGTRSWSN